MQCYACGGDVALASGERIGFRESCRQCSTDLHVCRNCQHYDPGAYNACREPNAERISDRERANRCDYFAPGSASGAARSPAGAAAAAVERERARAALKSLFEKP